MEKQANHKSILVKKRKRKASITVAASEPKTIKVDPTVSKVKENTTAPITKKKKGKKKSKPTTGEPEKLNVSVQKTGFPAVMFKGLTMDEIGEKYPILKNNELIDRFMKVPLNNNQKGRIRQAIRAQLQGSDNNISADIINGKIQTILKNENLTDSDLRRIRILYNMLKTSLEQTDKTEEQPIKEKNENKVEKPKEPKEKDEEPKKEKVTNKDAKAQNKVKGPKRYVVFIGNLPLDVDKAKLMAHFSEIDEHIKDIRIPKPAEDKKSGIAFMEVKDERTYEMALSKHHSMLDNKRINVMYTAQQNGKVTKSEAKGKAAKLIALQKAGKLAGSTAVTKKRSHRRNILKRAKAKEAAEGNA